MSVQREFLAEFRLTLQRLIDAGKLKAYYTTRQGWSQAPEFPFATIALGADLDYEEKTIGGRIWKASSQVILILALQRAEDWIGQAEAIDMLIDLVADVRAQIVKDMQTFSNKSITIRSIRQLRDPSLTALFAEMAIVPLGIEYTGLDKYE